MWMIALRMCVRGLGFVSTIVLARLLVPADFGLVAMAMIVWNILETVLDMNFSFALITGPENDRRYYDTAWTLSILRSCFVTVLLLVSAGAIAAYFKEPRIYPIIQLFALASLLSGFQNIGTVKFVKDLQLHRNFAMGVVNKLLSFSVTVGAAFLFHNYWALVLGTLTGRLATVGTSYLLCDFRPRFGLSKVRELFSFSAWLMANNIINSLVAQMDAVVMGRWATAGVLGLYRVALDISGLPASEIMIPARQALFGGFAKWASDPAKLAVNYIESQAVMLSVALPLAIGIALVAEPLTLTLLGNKWLAAAPIIRILVFSAIARILCDNAAVVLDAMRKPHLNTYVGGGVGLLYVAGLCVGVKYYGIYGAAIAHAASAFVYLIVNTLVLRRMLKASLIAVLRLAWRTILATLGMSAAVLDVERAYLVGGGWSAPAELLLLSLLGACVFAGIEAGLWAVFGGHGAEARIVEIASSLVGRRLAGRAPP